METLESPDSSYAFPPALSRDHHFGGFNDGQRLVAAPQAQRVDGVARDDSRKRLVTYAKPDLRHQSVGAYLFDDAAKLIAPAESGEHGRRWGAARFS